MLRNLASAATVIAYAAVGVLAAISLWLVAQDEAATAVSTPAVATTPTLPLVMSGTGAGGAAVTSDLPLGDLTASGGNFTG